MDQFTTFLIEEYPLQYEENRQLLSKALRLFRSGNVHNVYQDGTNIFGKVEVGSSTYHTLIDTDMGEFSRCSCDTSSLCPHALAVYLTMWAKSEPITTLMEQWKAAKKENVPAQLVYDESSLASWLQYLQSQYEHFRSTASTNHQISSIYYTFLPKVQLVAPKKGEIRQLFIVHAAIFCMEKMMEEADQHPPQYVRDMILRVIDVLEEQSKSLAHHALSFQLDTLLKESCEVVNEFFLKEDDFLNEKFFVVEYMWKTVYQKRNWMGTVRKDIAELTSFPASILNIHLLLLLKKEEEALQWIKRDRIRYGPFIFHWLRMLSKTGAWSQMAKLVDGALSSVIDYILAEGIYNKKRQLSSYLLKLLTSLAKETGNDEPYVYAMEKLLPYSFTEFEWYLYETKEYRKWMELHLFLGFDWNALDSYRLKMIQKEAPSVLLPFYHRGVEEKINERNRKSYKEAVRLLKKLLGIYKKEKKLSYWDAYFPELANRTKRLRSFQEELKRGKLLP